MKIDNLFDEISFSVLSLSVSNVHCIYLVFSLVTNNDKEGSVLGLNTVLDKCVHTRINYFLDHACMYVESDSKAK